LLIVGGVFAQGSNESSAPNEVKEVTISNFFVEGQGSHDQLISSFKNFEADHPDIHIVNDALPGAVYSGHIADLAAADDLPESFLVLSNFAKQYGKSGMQIPLNDYMQKYGLDTKLYKSVIAEHTDTDGTIYSIPTSIGLYGFIVYNKDIFEKAGVTSFPETLEELDVACAKIKAAGFVPIAIGDKELWGADSLLFSAFVNNFVGNDWYDDIRAKNGKASFNDPSFVAALTAYQHLAEEGYLNVNIASLNNAEKTQMFMQEKCAIISAGDWECNQICKTAPEVAAHSGIETWPSPAVGAKAENSIVTSCAYGFGLGSQNTDEENDIIMDWLANYYLVEDLAAVSTEQSGGFSCFDYEYDHSKVTPLMAELHDVDFTGCLNWDSTTEPALHEIYQRGLQEMLILEKSPKELAAQMQTVYERSL
jgi:raffinose/stachyose/melibiose transport system substrate-binding protein